MSTSDTMRLVMYIALLIGTILLFTGSKLLNKIKKREMKEDDDE